MKIIAKPAFVGIQFALSVFICACVASVVLFLWYPAHFAEMLQTYKLIVIIVCCDFVLGPVLSMVVYSSKKELKDLVADNTVVVVIRIVVVAYGMYVAYQAKPEYVVFVVDRYVVVKTGELSSDLKNNVNKNNSTILDNSDVRLFFVEKPKNSELQFEMILSAIQGGRDLQHMTDKYEPINQHAANVLSRSYSVEELGRKFPDKVDSINQAIADSGQDSESLRWLPVQSGSIFWTVLIDGKSGLPLIWLNIDPF